MLWEDVQFELKKLVGNRNLSLLCHPMCYNIAELMFLEKLFKSAVIFFLSLRNICTISLPFSLGL